jgi:hypothetical protein
MVGCDEYFVKPSGLEKAGNFLQTNRLLVFEKDFVINCCLLDFRLYNRFLAASPHVVASLLGSFLTPALT